MEGQGEIAVVHAAGIKECKDTAQKTEVHEESEKNAAYSRRIAPGEDQADIHGDAAQLEWKIPPVIGSLIHNISKTVLFPDLADKHQKTTVKKEIFI